MTDRWSCIWLYMEAVGWSWWAVGSDCSNKTPFPSFRGVLSFAFSHSHHWWIKSVPVKSKTLWGTWSVFVLEYKDVTKCKVAKTNWQLRCNGVASCGWLAWARQLQRHCTPHSNICFLLLLVVKMDLKNTWCQWREVRVGVGEAQTHKSDLQAYSTMPRERMGECPHSPTRWE